MKIEVLRIDDCHNAEEATRRLRAALDATGHYDTAIVERVLNSAVEVQAVAFAGSPTLTLDGVDLFPDGVRTTELACRLYNTPSGLTGTPTIDQLACAISDATGSGIHCSCCGRGLPRRWLHALNDGGAYICRRCGAWLTVFWRGDSAALAGH